MFPCDSACKMDRIKCTCSKGMFIKYLVHLQSLLSEHLKVLLFCLTFLVPGNKSCLSMSSSLDLFILFFYSKRCWAGKVIIKRKFLYNLPYYPYLKEALCSQSSKYFTEWFFLSLYWQGNIFLAKMENNETHFQVLYQEEESTCCVWGVIKIHKVCKY